MTSRTYAAPVAEPTPAERTSESRRRADRARPPAVQPAPGETERDEATSPAAGPERTNFSAGSIPTTPAGQDGPGGEGALLAEGAGPPPAPEPGITAEQVAAREEQLAAAQTALDSAEESPGLMDALAAAPPTLKAQVSGDLGQRFSEAMGSETEQIQQDTPEITAEMNGNTPPPAGQITDPAVTTVELEPTPPTPTPDAEAIIGSGTTVDENYSANDSVTAQFRRNFDAEGGADDVNRALDSVQTRDPSIPSSPGTPPIVPQSGETDPQRFGNQIAEGSLQARNTLADQQEQARALPGADRVQLADVHESVPVGDLPPPTAESGAAPEGAQQYLQMDQPPEVQTAFDQIAGEGMQQSLAEAQTQVQQAAQDRDTQHQEAVATAQSDTAEAQQQAESDQRDQIREARNGIEGQRRSTLEQQQNAVADVEQQAEDRRSTDRDQFDDRVRTDQAQIDGRYSQAETDANNEITAGERQAEEERRRKEREAEDQSWWEAALDFITDLFDALVSLINDIFDAVRAAVNAILDAVRDFAIGLIDALADALKSLIHAFGDFLKGLVQGLLGDLFPELAAALTAFIDEAVALADRAIDAVAETLKSAVNAIVEALRAGLMALINIYQAAVNAALSLARAALTGDWSAFLIQLLEAACRVAGIDPNTIYEFIGRAQETIDIIVNDPGQFVSNILDAVLGGFRLFADNFLTHLQTSVIEWLTGALGGAGITLPERFDLMGVISLVAQILGLTWENLRLRLVRIVGERGVQVIEFVASYIQTLIEGGWSALWERIQNDLATLRDMVLEQLRNFIVERIIMAAVTRLATMFNPVGALVNLLIAAYNFYTFVRDQMQRIVQVVTTVGGMIIDIAHGNLGPAQQAVEGVLARLLTLALDLLARLLGLGNVGERVRGILQRVQDTIWRAIDRLINSVIGLFRGGGEGGTPVAAADAEAGAPGTMQVGERVPIPVPEGATHHLFIRIQNNNPVVFVASTESVLQQFLVSQSVEELRTNAAGRGYVDTARRQVSLVNVEANQLLALARREPDQQRLAAENSDVTRAEQELVVSLTWIFRRLELSEEGPVELSRDVVLDGIDTQDRRVDNLLEIVAFDPDPLATQLSNLRTARTRFERLRGEVRNPSIDRLQLQQRQNDVETIREEIDSYERDPGIQDNRTRLEALRRNLQTEALSNSQWRQITDEVVRILSSFRDEIMGVVPATRVGFRGSMARGWRGPQKVTPEGAAQRFDPSDFDCDAYIEVPLSLWMQEIEPVLPVQDQRQTHKFRTLDEIRGWQRASQIAAIENRILSEIEGVKGILRGFRIDPFSGRPAFHFFIQSPDATLDLQLQAAGYRRGAFEQAGARGIEIVLPVRGGVLRYPQTVIEV